MAVPKIIYKYKPIIYYEAEKNSVKDNSNFEYILDIIENNRIYCPTRSQLNDPFESMQFTVYGAAFAGGGLYTANGFFNPYLKEIIDSYRILSFTDDCHSPIMWALYANNYNGVCFGFSSEKAFKELKKVEYIAQGDWEYYMINDKDLEEKIKSEFYKKLNCWEKESEYRIVQKEKEFLYFDKSELQFIIIGHNVSEKYKDKLKNICKEKGIKVYRTIPNEINNTIMIKTIDYEMTWDGVPIISDI